MAREAPRGLREWFQPKDGIDREVISANIQRYLGPDATVRPGRGTGNDEGVDGYWIRAYRTLTNTCNKTPAGGRKSFERPEQEVVKFIMQQRWQGPQHLTVAQPDRRFAQPERERQYQTDGRLYPQEGRGYPPDGRAYPPENRAYPPDNRAYPPDNRAYPPENRAYPPENRAYPPDNRAYPPDNRAYPPDNRVYPPDNRAYPPENRAYRTDARQPYQPEQPMAPAYGCAPVAPGFPPESRFPQGYQPNDPPPPGLVQRVYVPVSAYEPAPGVPLGRSEPPQYQTGPYGQPPAPGRAAREPRYGGPPDYAEPRFDAYPSPATTTASVNGREREPITSPAQASPYGAVNPAQYDQYNRPVMSPPVAAQEERRVPAARGDAANGRERERAPAAPGNPEGRNIRRRAG
ncbi:hypothetical protein LTR91_020707 [Friedmanniomyces endolithicus]|uniref:Uncharacterized protein n=1 Tax=Friedmanniomyces endolithicus TaxID=329885 RepID=A0AAN6HDS6_9PEZI|nr:hypothetical protein LTR91_020707 [Friedmanniomyces endolithicus]